MDQKVSDASPSGEDDLMTELGNGRTIETNVEEGRVICEFQARPTQCHSGGVVQGGFVTGWLDTTMARAAMASANYTKSMTTLELKTMFYRPAKAGVVYRSEGWVERSASRVIFMEARITAPDGTVIAKGSSTCQWLPLSQEAAERLAVERGARD